MLDTKENWFCASFDNNWLHFVHSKVYTMPKLLVPFEKQKNVATTVTAFRYLIKCSGLNVEGPSINDVTRFYIFVNTLYWHIVVRLTFICDK